MKYIVFDLDGTLIDSMPVWRGTGSGFLKNHNFPVPANLMDVVKTQPIWQTAEWFRSDLGVPMEAEDIVNEIVESVVEAYRHTIPLKDGVKEFFSTTRLYELTYRVNGEEYKGLFSFILVSNANHIAGFNNFYNKHIIQCIWKKINFRIKQYWRK